MKNFGPLAIGVLCATVALLVAFMAAPARRTAAIIVVSVPFAIGSFAAFRQILRNRRATTAGASAVSNEGRISDWVAPVDQFLDSVPALNQSFRSWAASVAGHAPMNQRDLEDFCVRHAAAIEPGTPLFRQFVASYGEIVRDSAKGRWGKGHWFYRDEPVVRGSRFPYLGRRVVREAYELLEAAEGVRHV